MFCPFPVRRILREDIHILSKLHESPFSIVSLVKLNQDDSPIRLMKTLKMDPSNHMAQVAFGNELSALYVAAATEETYAKSDVSRKDHSFPHLVGILDDCGELGFVTEYFSHSEQLFTFLEGSSNLYHDICSVFLDLARLLCALHSKQLVHCDINPANILVSTSGNVKLVDFGQSCFVSSPEAYTCPLTGRKTCYGPTRPPEIVETGTICMASDVYSFGALLRLTCQKHGVVSAEFDSVIMACTQSCPPMRPSAPDLKRMMQQLLQMH